MRIDISTFKGTAPQVAPHLLPDGGATVAKSCELGFGDLRPIHGLSAGDTTAIAGDIKTLYRYLDSFWFTWLADVDVVRGPVAGDTSGRVYFTGDGVPKFTYASVATSGSIYPSVDYTLGVPAPATAATLSIAGGTASDDIADQRDRVYVYTYSNDFGEESAPSPASSIITVSGTQTVLVDSLDNPPSGSYAPFQYKNIYRTDENGAYRYVASVDVANSSYTDAIDDAALGAELLTTDWNMPRDDMQGLTFMPGGTLVGFSGKTVCFSVQNQPHAWPVAGEYVVHDDIVAIGTFGSSVFVATTSYPVVLTGADYSSMSVERLEVSQACLYKRGMVDAGTAIMYPSPEGLTLVGTSSARVLTEGTVDREQWSALIEGFRFGVYHDGKYIAFTDTGGFIVSLADGSIIDHDIMAVGGYLHEKTGKLYLTKDNDSTVYEWDAGSAIAYTWRSREYQLPLPGNFGLVQVVAEAYPVTVTVYADGEQKAQYSVGSARALRLPGGFRARTWELSLEGTNRVLSAHLAQSAQELQQG